jgi:hypothetical protein
MLTRRWLWLAAALFLALLLSPTARSQTRLTTSVLASGATASSGGGFFMAGTIGQPIIGRISGTGGSGSLGFWYTLPRTTTSGIHEERTSNATADAATVQVFPNPVSDHAEIRVSLPASGSVSLRLFDALGQERTTLVSGERAAGTLTVKLGTEYLESGSYTLLLVANGTRYQTTMRVVK